jgi:hypothetical protein
MEPTTQVFADHLLTGSSDLNDDYVVVEVRYEKKQECGTVYSLYQT